MIPPFLQRWPIDFFLVAMPYTLLEQEGLEELEICAARGGSIVICAPYVSGILVRGPGPCALYRYQPAEPAIVSKAERILDVCRRHHVPLAACSSPWGTAASLRSSRGRSHPRKCAKTLPGCGSRSPKRYGRNSRPSG